MLNELTTKKQQIEARLEELERLSLSQAEIDTIVTEGTRQAAKILTSLCACQTETFLSPAGKKR